MLSRQSCILDSLPCIPDSKWILDSNLKFQISQAKFSWILDAPIFFPHSGIRSPLHGATRPYHFTLAFIRPGWLSSTNSSLLSTSPYLQSKERLFFEIMPGILFALRWYTIRIVRFILSWWPHGCCCFFFFVKFIDGGINTAAGRLSTKRDRFIPTTKRHTYTIDTGFRATYIPAA